MKSPIIVINLLCVYIISECHSSDQAVVKFYEKLDDLLRCWEEYIVENIPVSCIVWGPC